MEHEMAERGYNRRRNANEQSRSQDQKQKDDWRFQVIELKYGGEDRATQASSIGAAAIVVIIAAAQIPDGQVHHLVSASLPMTLRLSRGSHFFAMVSSHWLVAVRFSGDFLNGKKARRASSLPAPNGGSLFRRSPYSGYGEYA